MAAYFLLRFRITLIVCFYLILQSYACKSTVRFRSISRTFGACMELEVQGASLAWTLDPHNHIANISFSGTAPSASGWVGWGINPTALSMSGTSSFIAFKASNGSNLLPYKLTEETEANAPLICSPIDLLVLDKDVQISGSSVSMFVSLQLSPNHTVLNHVWNRGSSVTRFQPGPHALSADSLSGLRSINMFSPSIVSQTASSRQTLKNRHGILNAVAWGLILPIGAICARYMRTSTNTAWFYAHIILQCIGYGVGVAGWAIGMELGSSSKYVEYHRHYVFGVALFVFSTLQVMALFLRPNKDHKLRKYWNIYHHTIGYIIIILGITNIYEGFDILSPAKKWYKALYATLGTLAGIVVLLESVCWIIYFKRRRIHAKKSDFVENKTSSRFENEP